MSVVSLTLWNLSLNNRTCTNANWACTEQETHVFKQNVCQYISTVLPECQIRNGQEMQERTEKKVWRSQAPVNCETLLNKFINVWSLNVKKVKLNTWHTASHHAYDVGWLMKKIFLIAELKCIFLIFRLKSVYYKAKINKRVAKRWSKTKAMFDISFSNFKTTKLLCV